ncbi:hypothetical protein [Candidatus Sororendozoicomonas aggregata]|uniref:hypothetical protein n=1 Tax=Candidatus Sororendozoicomonas aggregata TaxID=3073239 RepID=UPI002ED587BA
MSLPLSDRVEAFKQTYFNYLETHTDIPLKKLRALNKACGSFCTRKVMEWDCAQTMRPPRQHDDLGALDKPLTHRRPSPSPEGNALTPAEPETGERTSPASSQKVASDSPRESALNASLDNAVPETELLTNPAAKDKRKLRPPRNHPRPSAQARKRNATTFQSIDALLMFMQKGMKPDDYQALGKAYRHPKKETSPQKHLMNCCREIVQKKESALKQKHVSFLGQACKLLSHADLTELYNIASKKKNPSLKTVVAALKPFLNKQYFLPAAERIKATIREGDGVLRKEPAPKPYERLLANPDTVEINDFSRLYKDHLKSQNIFSEDRYRQAQDLYAKIDREQPEQCQQFASEVLRGCSPYQQTLLQSAAEIYHIVASEEGPRGAQSMDTNGLLTVLMPNILQPPTDTPLAEISKNLVRDRQLLKTLMEYMPVNNG